MLVDDRCYISQITLVHAMYEHARGNIKQDNLEWKGIKHTYLNSTQGYSVLLISVQYIEKVKMQYREKLLNCI